MDPERLNNFQAGRELLQLVDKHDLHNEIVTMVCRLCDEVQEGRRSAPAGHLIHQGQTATAVPPLCTILDLNLLSPRGKHNLNVYPDSLVVTSAKAEITIPTSAVQAVAILDNIPRDQKGKVLMFLSLTRKAMVMSGKQRLEALVIQTTADAQQSVPVHGSDTCTGPAAIVLCQLLGMAGITSFVSPDPEAYTNSQGALAVSAVFKVNDGYLFPMPSGALCFIERPPMYIPYHNIRYVTFARTGSTCATFDLQVHLCSKETIEFSQIAHGELGMLQSWCSRVRLKASAEEAAAAEARVAAAREKANTSGAGPSGVNANAAEAAANEDDSTDEEDEDFDPTEEEGGKGGRHGSRKQTRVLKRKRDSGDGAGPSTSRGAESGEDIGDDDEEDDEEEEEEEESSDDDSEDIEVEDEDAITAADIAQDIARDRGGKRGQRLQLNSSDEDDELEDEDC